MRARVTIGLGSAALLALAGALWKALPSGRSNAQKHSGPQLARTESAQASLRGLDDEAWHGALAVSTPAELRALVRRFRAAAVTDTNELRAAALRSPDPAVAGNALRALGRLRAIAGDGELLRLALDPRARVRAELIRAAGVDGTPSVVPMLERAVAGGDATERRLAIEALGRVGDERARQYLAALLENARTDEIERAFVRSALDPSSRLSTTAPRGHSSRFHPRRDPRHDHPDPPSAGDLRHIPE